MLNPDAVGYTNPQMQKAARILGSLAKHRVHDTQYILKVITSHTFSAEEQIYLLDFSSQNISITQSLRKRDRRS